MDTVLLVVSLTITEGTRHNTNYYINIIFSFYIFVRIQNYVLIKGNSKVRFLALDQ